MAEIFKEIIAALTGAGCRAGKRSLRVRCPVSGQVPCSGARRRGEALDEVSAAIPGDAVAGNDQNHLTQGQERHGTGNGNNEHG
jgi:hypothetical protein